MKWDSPMRDLRDNLKSQIFCKSGVRIFGPKVGIFDSYQGYTVFQGPHPVPVINHDNHYRILTDEI